MREPCARLDRDGGQQAAALGESDYGFCWSSIFIKNAAGNRSGKERFFIL